MTAVIIRADARRLPLPDESVDLIVTSPPYYQQRTYQDGGARLLGQIGLESTPAEYLAALLECTREWMRVLKPTGSLWVNLGDKYSQRTATGRSAHQSGLHPGREGVTKNWRRDRALGLARMPRENITDPATGRYVPEKSLMGLPWRYALGAIDDLGLILRAEVVWSKTFGKPDTAGDRVGRRHEQWFHLVCQRRYYAAANIRGMGSVWECAPGSWRAPAHLGAQHHAAYPPTLIQDIILGWSPPDGLVLDPFGGTGTTAIAAARLGRHGVSVDMSADYCRLAAWRTTDPGERARALGVPKPPPVPDGQDSLFEEIA